LPSVSFLNTDSTHRYEHISEHDHREPMLINTEEMPFPNIAPK
jgi:hypothetical protein